MSNEEWILKAGAITAAVGGMGGLLMWLYQKLFKDPYAAEFCKLREEQNRQLKDTLTPLTHALDRLSELPDESESDRTKLHQMNDLQNKQLGQHEMRIVRLEDFKDDHQDRVKRGRL